MVRLGRAGIEDASLLAYQDIDGDPVQDLAFQAFILDDDAGGEEPGHESRGRRAQSRDSGPVLEDKRPQRQNERRSSS